MVLSLVAACVTVNVNFPESAVQKAADDYVKELYRAKEKQKQPSPESTGKPQASRLSLFPEAYAAELDSSDIRFDSPKLRAIQGKQAAIVDELKKQKRAGFIGETNEATLALRDGDKLPPPIRAKIEKLIQQENGYRQDQYSAIQSEKNFQIQDVKRTFMRAYQSESPSGTWVQNANGAWERKP